MLPLALVRGRTASCTLLPEAPSIWRCVSGGLSSCPFQTGAGSDAMCWGTPCSSTPVPSTLCVQLSSAGAHKSLVERWWGPQVGILGPWGPQACATSEGWWGSQMGTVGAGRQTRHPSPVSCRVLKGSSHSSFWSLPPLDESQKQWRRDESFCVPKAIP